MTRVPPGRQRYLNWPDREKVRLDTIARQQAALNEVGVKRINTAFDKLDILRGGARDGEAPANSDDYPKPKER